MSRSRARGGAAARRRRADRARKLRSLLAVLGLVAAVIVGVQYSQQHHPSGAATGTRPAAAVANKFEIKTPTPQVRGACIDSTSSVAPQFSAAVRDDIAAALTRLVPPTAALPDQPGVPNTPISAPAASYQLTVREVFTNSGSSDLLPYTRTVAVPGAAGLTGSKPSVTDADFDATNPQWRSAYAQVSRDRAAAAAAARTAGATISQMPLIEDPNNSSGIVACMSTLLETTPAAGRRSYLIASDLQDNSNLQVAGSFHGAPLLIVQTCRSGNLDTCQGYLDAFTAYMKRMHVGAITVVRPEQMGPAISAWVRTGHP